MMKRKRNQFKNGDRKEFCRQCSGLCLGPFSLYRQTEPPNTPNFEGKDQHQFGFVTRYKKVWYRPPTESLWTSLNHSSRFVVVAFLLKFFFVSPTLHHHPPPKSLNYNANTTHQFGFKHLTVFQGFSQRVFAQVERAVGILADGTALAVDLFPLFS